jgi:hypothetical protein
LEANPWILVGNIAYPVFWNVAMTVPDPDNFRDAAYIMSVARIQMIMGKIKLKNPLNCSVLAMLSIMEYSDDGGCLHAANRTAPSSILIPLMRTITAGSTNPRSIPWNSAACTKKVSGWKRSSLIFSEMGIMLAL